MPYRRNYRKNQRRPRGNKVKKLTTGQGPTMLENMARGAGAVATLARAVMPIVAAINTEHKYLDTNQSIVAHTPGTNDSITLLTGALAQGLTDQTRVGNSILMRNIMVRGLLVQDMIANTFLYGFTRIILLVWKENADINAPTAAKIFETTAFDSPMNRDFTDQMVIIKDKVYAHEAPINVTLPQAPFHFKWFKKLDFHSHFDGATAADYTTNHLYLVVRGSGGAASSESFVTYYSRLNYTDN